MQTLNFITGNANKLAEVRAILGYVVDLQSQAVDVPEFQGTIDYIAKEKCRRAAEAVSSISISGSDSIIPNLFRLDMRTRRKSDGRYLFH